VSFGFFAFDWLRVFYVQLIVFTGEKRSYGNSQNYYLGKPDTAAESEEGASFRRLYAEAG
jgi:hypothetical protein